VPDAPLKLRVHDTLSRRKVGVKPSPGKGGRSVRLYVCGITPYDAGHMGHAFTFCTYDILIRFIEASGVRVRYVQNITDVDDPLFERARRDSVDWRDLADKETAIHLRDMDALGWRRPDFLPRVSDEIKPILSAAGKLYAAGYGYQTDAVYFDASKYRGYGRLSRRTRRSMIRKLRHEDLLGMVGPGAKRDALDFPLWRGSAPDEPAWPSQFGPGRPGWLPPMAQWYSGLLPYPYLLPAQVLILALMAVIATGVSFHAGPLAQRQRAVGFALLVVSLLYAGSMVLRYILRMRRHPDQRWLGGTIPIVFHLVLAAFLFTFASWQLS